MPGLFDRLRRTVDASGLAEVVTPTDERPLIPAPPPVITARTADSDLVGSLRRELNAANATVARLEQLLETRPPAPPSDRHCPNCAGLQQTITLLQDERKQLRRRLAKHELTRPQPAPFGSFLEP